VHNCVQQSFSCKINSTQVKYTTTKLHVSPDKAARARSQSPSKERLQLLAKIWTPGDSDLTPPVLSLRSTFFQECNYEVLEGRIP